MSKQGFERVAIINRGEPAIRFMRAAATWSRIHQQPLDTVAFYTTPDQFSLYVRRASEAVYLGEALQPGADGTMRSAYLDIPRIIELCQQAGATAVWPGWGFLAENAEFADACAEAGLTFLGPSGDTMRLLGDKIEAKRMAEDNGVPVTGWSRDAVRDPAHATELAEQIGYPVLLKASAGGGGRGIRRVDSASDVAQAFQSASQEAASAFGNPALLLEKMVTEARHIEVQVLADSHGNTWALGTRDCSVQRRNQKVIEEAPAPNLPSEIEKSLCDSAVTIARLSDYVGAGTVEFLLEPKTHDFYFLEMNTRLQVEHTITEEIYGVDLVLKQIEIAQGEALPSPNAPQSRGHAIELRLNAEDPDENFAPSVGEVLRFESPQGPGIRVDSGYAAGDVVPSDFDSNIAKVIAWGADRREAYARMRTVLRDTVVALEGGLTNRALLMELIAHPELLDKPVTTRWLEGYLDSRPALAARPRLDIALAAAAIGDHLRQRRGQVLNFFQESQRGLPRQIPTPAATRWKYSLGKESIGVSVETIGPSEYRLGIEQNVMDVKARSTGARTMLLQTDDGKRYSVLRIATAAAIHTDVEGTAHRFTRTSDGRALAPIPAAITGIHVSVGDAVAVGERLVTLEAMKMESGVEATRAGVVTEIAVEPGGRVAAGDLLMTIEAASSQEQDGGSTQLNPLAGKPDGGRSAEGALRSALLGYDISGSVLQEVYSHLRENPKAISGDELLALLDIAMLGEELLGQEAASSETTPLVSFLRHPEQDDDQLPDGFKQSLERFYKLYQVTKKHRGFELGSAFLRLFQSRANAERYHGILGAIVDAVGSQEIETEADIVRYQEALETFAGLALQLDRQLAQQVWQAIYRTCYRPRIQADARALEAQAEASAQTLDSKSARTSLLEMPFGTLVTTLPKLVSMPKANQVSFLRLLLQHIYESDVSSVIDHPTEAILVRQSNRGEGDVLGVLINDAAHIDLLPQWNAVDATQVDIFLCFEPTAKQLTALQQTANSANRVTVAWSNADKLPQLRTYRRENDTAEEQTLVNNLHPARAIARELQRYEAFHLRKLDAPDGIFLALASAKDGSGDDRLVALGEISRYDASYAEVGGMHVPSFEKKYFDAAYALSQAMSQHATEHGKGHKRHKLVWNTITLFISPLVRVNPADITAVSGRLTPWATGLGLEKVTVHSNFLIEGRKNAKPRRMAVEWSDPTHRGAVLAFRRPSRRPVQVLSEYERRVVEAKRRGRLPPYELIRLIAADSLRSGFFPGRFQEHDLDESQSNLVAVERPYGENTANLVVGIITNPTKRYPEGVPRVLIVGDPTRSMGALAEPECRRIIAALDLAQKQNIPVEWVPISSGAKIAFDSGTENLDWTARVLRHIIEFTQEGGVINIIVDGICVGAQSYWNAEATMLMHCRGTLVMTPAGCMLLTGRRALEYAGSVSAPTNEGVGGLTDIMGPNGQAQYSAPDLREAYNLLLQHYDLTHIPADETAVRRVDVEDSPTRRLDSSPYGADEDFGAVGDIFSDAHNPGRKRPFAIREVISALVDQDVRPIERWQNLQGGETAVVMHAQLGGWPVTCVGIESRPVKRKEDNPIDGPEEWSSGTLFPQSSWKVARALNAASGVTPAVVVANLSGFDGSPESMRNKQLEFGAEIGRAVVNFKGPIVFCVIARYHGGAYVVFSQTLNPNLQSIALEGSYASVIGGGPAAAVVFPHVVKKRVAKAPRVLEAKGKLGKDGPDGIDQAAYDKICRETEAEIHGEVAKEFDTIHSVERAREVGSISNIVSAESLRAQLCQLVEDGMTKLTDKS